MKTDQPSDKLSWNNMYNWHLRRHRHCDILFWLDGDGLFTYAISWVSERHAEYILRPKIVCSTIFFLPFYFYQFKLAMSLDQIIIILPVCGYLSPVNVHDTNKSRLFEVSMATRSVYWYFCAQNLPLTMFFSQMVSVGSFSGDLLFV